MAAMNVTASLNDMDNMLESASNIAKMKNLDILDMDSDIAKRKNLDMLDSDISKIKDLDMLDSDIAKIKDRVVPGSYSIRDGSPVPLKREVLGTSPRPFRREEDRTPIFSEDDDGDLCSRPPAQRLTPLGQEDEKELDISAEQKILLMEIEQVTLQLAPWKKGL